MVWDRVGDAVRGGPRAGRERRLQFRGRRTAAGRGGRLAAPDPRPPGRLRPAAAAARFQAQQLPPGRPRLLRCPGSRPPRAVGSERVCSGECLPPPVKGRRWRTPSAAGAARDGRCPPGRDAARRCPAAGLCPPLALCPGGRPRGHRRLRARPADHPPSAGGPFPRGLLASRRAHITLLLITAWVSRGLVVCPSALLYVSHASANGGQLPRSGPAAATDPFGAWLSRFKLERLLLVSRF